MSLDKFRRAFSIAGNLVVRGIVTRIRQSVQIYLTEVTTTVTAAESGKTFIATKATATQDFILPSASIEGLRYTFIAGHAGGEITIQVDGTDTVACIADPGTAPEVSVVTSAGDGIINTAATNILNDQVTLVADGVSRWYAVAQQGIWASE